METELKPLCMKRCPDTGEACQLEAGHKGRHDPLGFGEIKPVKGKN